MRRRRHARSRDGFRSGSVRRAGNPKSIGLSKNTTPPPEGPASQSDRIAEGVNLAMARMPDADRPRASTKRAVLIGMLERPEGASVTETGQRLGRLPPTGPAALTALPTARPRG